MKKSRLNNKTVILTGASGGLGFNIAKILVEEYGAYVIGICRNEQKMLNSLSQITKNKENFSYRVFDVRDKDKWNGFYKELIEKNINVDVLINNAGFMLPFEKFENLSEEETDEIIDTNFKANVTSIKTLMPLLKKSDNAQIVNIVSAAGLSAVIGQSLYTATKFAMKGLTDTLRVEYKGKIAVTGIYPGFIKTDILRRQKIDTSDNKLINSLMAPVDKIARKTVKAIIKRKKYLITGFDGKSMAFFGKFFPYFTVSAMAKVLKFSKQDLFKDLFKKD